MTHKCKFISFMTFLSYKILYVNIIFFINVNIIKLYTKYSIVTLLEISIVTDWATHRSFYDKTLQNNFILLFIWGKCLPHMRKNIYRTWLLWWFSMILLSEIYTCIFLPVCLHHNSLLQQNIMKRMTHDLWDYIIDIIEESYVSM